MRFAAAVAAFVGVASAQAWGSSSLSSSNSSEVYVTETVTAFTTYCPEATSITANGVTYTVSEATTLTITNCPCTVTKPVSSSSVAVAPVGTGAVSSVKPVASGVAPSGTGATGTGAVGTASGTGSKTGASSTTSPIVPAKGAASQVQAGVAAVLAVVGLVAVL